MTSPADGPASSDRHPHAGLPFDDSDDAIAAALEEVSIPTLLCTMVHLTGDPSWIRGDLRPAGLFLNEYQGYMDEESKAEVRRRALPEIIRYRDNGCVLPPQQPDAALLHEMMNFAGCAEIPDEVVPMMLDEMGLADTDVNRVAWVDDVPAAKRADFPVVVIGCGQSGLLAGIRLQEAGIPFTIIEKNGGPGGTWWENSYPGARVDVGSHFYCYSFEPSDHWTEYFSQQPELQRYFQNVMEHHGIDEHCRFDTEVVAATLDEATGHWSVVVRDADGNEDTLDARAVISAVGSLNRAKMPDIEGIDTFEGPSFHSTRWDHSVDYTGKRVALVGAGASGFQIAPTIAPAVEHLTIFQRTAQWMFPNPNYHEKVPEGQKWAIRHLPFFGRWFRFLQFWPGSGGDLSGSRIDPDYDDSDGRAVSERNAATREFFEGWLREQLEDRPDLIDKVVPPYPATGKRTLQDNGSWLACLKRDDVTLERTGIERIEPTGVRTTDGVLHEADIIVYATGFHHNRFLWPMDIRGRGGKTLAEHWGDEPTAYLGITVPEFPNLFCMYGPGTNLAHGGSLIFHSECQITYIMGCIGELLAGDHLLMEPKQDVHDAFEARRSEEIHQMVWSHWSIRHTHFRNPEGRIFTLSPWPIHNYQQWTKRPDPADYLFT
ncbi:MAG: NAD(P)/FAD-dependent oxidoreductase [Acidimicrobiales bacterium]|nr:NAD(P)/FAD-dependent oxidoreductase [Acidimicrobiales bacterium]